MQDGILCVYREVSWGSASTFLAVKPLMIKNKSTFRDVLDPHRKADRRRLFVSYILRTLGAVSAVVAAAMLGPVPVRKTAKALARFHKSEREGLRRALARLEKRGLVRRQKRDDGNEYLLLTEAGEQAYQQEMCSELKLERPAVWDRQWRIVIFDIPEDKKIVREALRKHLRNLGFLRLQKSVFVTPYPCAKEITFLQKFYEVEDGMCIICAVSLGEKENLARKHFHL